MSGMSDGGFVVDGLAIGESVTVTRSALNFDLPIRAGVNRQAGIVVVVQRAECLELLAGSPGTFEPIGNLLDRQ